MNINFIPIAAEEINSTCSDLDTIYKHIEICGKVCYQSEDNIKDNSYINFVNGLKKSGHHSVLEHGTFYLKLDTFSWKQYKLKRFFKLNPYSKVKKKGFGEYLVITNGRVIHEHNLTEKIKDFIIPEYDGLVDFKDRRMTVKCYTSVDISREYNRYKRLSISERSTRWCNFTKDKFNGIQICKNYFDFNSKEEEEHYHKGIEKATEEYQYLLKLGSPKDLARKVLPLQVATQVIYTGDYEEWEHILKERLAPNAHFDAQLLAQKIEPLFKEFYIIK